jgi:hypothetical protein
MLRRAHGLDHKQYEEFLRDRLAGVGWTTPDALFVDLGGQPEELDAHWASRMKWDLRVHATARSRRTYRSGKPVRRGRSGFGDSIGPRTSLGWRVTPRRTLSAS